MKYYRTSTTMASIKKTRANKCWQGCGKKQNICALLVKCKMIQSVWETAWRFLNKGKIGGKAGGWSS